MEYLSKQLRADWSVKGYRTAKALATQMLYVRACVYVTLSHLRVI